MTTPDLRLGRWQDALADVAQCDLLLCDPAHYEIARKRLAAGYTPGLFEQG